MKKRHIYRYIILAFLILGGITIVSFNYYVKWRLMQEINEFSARKINGLYEFKIGNTHLDLLSGVLETTDISVTTDTVQWNIIRYTYPDSFPPNIQMHIRSMDIRNFSWLGYFSNKTIGLRSLTFDQPEIHLLHKRSPPSKDSSLKDLLLQLPKFISPVAEILKIKYLTVKNGNIAVCTVTAEDSLFQQFRNVNLNFREINVNNFAREITFCREIEVKADHYESRQTAGSHTISFDQFIFSKDKSTISLRNLSVQPTLSERAFFSLQKYRKLYIGVSCPQINITGFDTDRMIRQDYMYIKSVLVDGAELEVVVNKFLPLPVRILPHELVQQIKKQFNIEEVIVKNSHIAAIFRQPGGSNTMTFDNTYVTAQNITNDTLLMDNKHPMELKAEMQFLNQSLMKVTLLLPLLAPGFNADCDATLESLPFAALNPMLSANNVTILSGMLKRMEVNSSIRNGVAGGTVKLDYADLKVQLQNKESGKSRKFVSIVANILINDKNVPDDDTNTAFTTGEIYAVRNQQESLFAFLWHAVQTGLIPSIVPSYDKLKGLKKK